MKGEFMVSKANTNPLARKALIFSCVAVTALFGMGREFLKADQYLYTRPVLLQNVLRFGGSWNLFGDLLALSSEAPKAEIPGPSPEYLRSRRNMALIYSSQIPLSEELQYYTFEQCVKNGLDYPMILAIMWRESRFTIDAVNLNKNGTKDSGIMQINDINRGWLAEELGVEDLMDPKQNIRAGTEILGRFTRKYGQHNALLAYQYGETGMKKRLSEGLDSSEQVEILYEKMADFEEILAENL